MYLYLQQYWSRTYFLLGFRNMVIIKPIVLSSWNSHFSKKSKQWTDKNAMSKWIMISAIKKNEVDPVDKEWWGKVGQGRTRNCI